MHQISNHSSDESQHSREPREWESTHQYQQDQISHQESEHENQIIEEALLIKIGKLMREIVSIKQKLFFYQDFSSRLRKENDQLQLKIVSLEGKINTHNQTLQEKEDQIMQLNKQISDIKKIKTVLEQKVASLQVSSNRGNSQKKNKDLLKINELLEKQLQISNSKVMELEQSIQDKKCLQLYGNISRLREASLGRKNVNNNTHCFTSQNPTVSLKPKKAYFDQAYYKMRARSTKNYIF